LEAVTGTHYRGSPRQVQALDVYIKLMRAAESVTASLQPGLATWALTPSQFGVLEALLHLGPMCQRELGEKLLKSSSNVTTVVDNLERSGLVERQRSLEDRRVVSVRLTDAGRRLVQKALPVHVAEIVAAFEPLAAAERRELARLCRKLGHAVAAAGTAAMSQHRTGASRVRSTKE
jgi:MarR family 2-MHQ and catechol resistance regulon transcriptional repressor